MKKFTIDPSTLTIIPVDKKAALGVLGNNSLYGAEFTLTGDLATKLKDLDVYVNFSSLADEESHEYAVTDLSYDASTETLTFSWPLDRRATSNIGPILFSIQFRSLAGVEADFAVYKDTILESIRNSLSPDEEDDFRTYYESLVDELEAYVEQVKTTIPSDYTELSEEVMQGIDEADLIAWMEGRVPLTPEEVNGIDEDELNSWLGGTT